MKFGNKEKVGKRYKVYEASKIYGIFVEIKIIDPNNNSNKEQPLINAFDLLMRSSTTLHLPEFNPIPRNAFDQLKIDITNLKIGLIMQMRSESGQSGYPVIYPKFDQIQIDLDDSSDGYPYGHIRSQL